MRRMMSVYVAAIIVSSGIALGIWSASSDQAKAATEPPLDSPKFEVDPFWPKPFPDLWVTGDVVGTCVDAQDHVFIVNRDNLTPVLTKNAV
jgi:hypothetical protein